MPTPADRWIERSLLARAAVFHPFFAREAPRLAEACRELAARFLRGGRLFAFGRGAYATDAQHVAVEFTHPVIVGKRALPASDLSPFFRSWSQALVRPDDAVMAFGPPDGDADVHAALADAEAKGAMTFALPGSEGSYALAAASDDPFLHQESLELLYHVLWETVHVFFEHREVRQDAGAAGFLYPFLRQPDGQAPDLTHDVAGSILLKVQDAAALRAQTAEEAAAPIREAIRILRERLARGGQLVLFGNGGSATDANDWAIDCVAPPRGWRPLPAISLSYDPATLTAIANDVGHEVVFLRQLIAHARPNDVAIALSTSGSSRNIVVALAEARKRGLATMALLGSDGGEIARQGLADCCIVVRSDYVPRIQEVHASIYHVIREALGADLAAT